MSSVYRGCTSGLSRSTRLGGQRSCKGTREYRQGAVDRRQKMRVHPHPLGFQRFQLQLRDSKLDAGVWGLGSGFGSLVCGPGLEFRGGVDIHKLNPSLCRVLNLKAQILKICPSAQEFAETIKLRTLLEICTKGHIGSNSKVNILLSALLADTNFVTREV